MQMLHNITAALLLLGFVSEPCLAMGETSNQNASFETKQNSSLSEEKVLTRNENHINSKIQFYQDKYCGPIHPIASGSVFSYNPYVVKGQCFLMRNLVVYQIIDRHKVLVRPRYGNGELNRTAIIYFENNPPELGAILSGPMVDMGTLRYTSVLGEMVVAPLLRWTHYVSFRNLIRLQNNDNFINSEHPYQVKQNYNRNRNRNKTLADEYKNTTAILTKIYERKIVHSTPLAASELKRNEIDWIIKKRASCGTVANAFMSGHESNLECLIKKTKNRIKELE